MNIDKRLYRSTQDRMFAGVCGGIAEYLEVDPTLVRLVFVALAFFGGGAGIFMYIIMMLIVPEQPLEKNKHYYDIDENSKNSVIRSSVPVSDSAPEEAAEITDTEAP